MAWPSRRIHLEKKGKVRSKVGFGSLFVLLAAGKFVQSSDGLAVLLRKGDQMQLQASWDPWVRWR